MRFLAGAGLRGTLELVGHQVLAELRDGTAPEEIALVLPSVERSRETLETVFAGFEIPLAVESRLRFPGTPLGHALVSMLRFAWSGGGRRELYAFLRTPYSGIPRPGVDFAEGAPQGPRREHPQRVEEETSGSARAPLVALRELRDAESPLEGVRTVIASMTRAAYGSETPPTERSGPARPRDVRRRDRPPRRACRPSRNSARRSTARRDRRLPAPRGARRPDRLAGRVAVLDLLRARTRRFETVFVLGLEEGSPAAPPAARRSSTTTPGARSAHDSSAPIP